MEVVITAGAGIDIHKRTAVVCCRLLATDGTLKRLTNTFGTMTADLLALSDWLTRLGVTHVAMESTGEYWKPLFNILEGSFTLVVANAQHIKRVPGRKTDMRDAEWLAELLCHGLLRPSFIPPQAQRDVRDLTRQRTNLVQDRASVVNRLQKVLEWANLKLASVASNVLGMSARAMLEAIVSGETDPGLLADLARGRLKGKRATLEQALSGRVRAHHRFLIAQHLEQIDFLDEQIAALNTQIADSFETASTPPEPPDDGQAEVKQPASNEPAQTSEPSNPAPGERLNWKDAVAIWDSLPGIGQRVAEMLVAEVGVDLERFASAGHLASWAKLCPGSNESAGKRRACGTGRGNTWLRSGLIQAAHAAVRQKESALAHLYRRLAPRRGKKKAMLAVAHRLLTLGYTLLRRREYYCAPDQTIRDAQERLRLAKQLQRKLEHLGFPSQFASTEALA